MKNAIILHGVRDKDEPESSMSGGHWIPWLKKNLESRGILTDTPELPNPVFGKCKYDEWLREFLKSKVNKDTILIGHSAGGGFLIKYLSLNPDVKCDRLVLVAPWLDTEHECGEFLSGFELDKKLPERVAQIDLFYSTDDDDFILKSVDKIRETYPKIKVHEFFDKGHFCKDDLKSLEFPELLEVIK